MILLRNQEIRMSVFRVQDKGNYLDFSGSTAERDRNDNTKYINSYWNVRLVGHAYNSFKGKLNDRDRIVIKDCKITNEQYEKDGQKRTYMRILVTEAEPFNGNGVAQNSAQAKPKKAEDSEELPF